MMSYIALDQKDQIVLVTIDREKKLNALNNEVIHELSEVFESLAKDTQVRAVVLTGSGSKAFVAGADISGFPGLSGAEAQALAQAGQHQLFDRIAHFSKPVIAAINGYALGGGLELALACHLRIASEHAQMGLPEVSLGLIPGYGGTQRLPQIIGKGRALEMILSAQMVDAQKALNWGMVNGIVPQENLLEEAISMAKRILKNAPFALGAAIAAIQHPQAGQPEGFAFEAEQFGSCFGTEDFNEGVSAFLEKRKPSY